MGASCGFIVTIRVLKALEAFYSSGLFVNTVPKRVLQFLQFLLCGRKATVAFVVRLVYYPVAAYL